MNCVHDPNLVLYLPLYKLDGSSMMSQDSYGHLCSVAGALWTPTGRSFDGVDDRITTPINGTDGPQITVVFWARANTLPFGGYCFILDNSPGSQGYMVRGDNGTSVMRINAYMTGSGLKNCSADIPDTNFHFYTAQIAATFIRIKVDSGGWSTNAFSSDTLVLSSDTIKIGASVEGGSAWKGYIGEVMVYSRLLTEPEIQRHYLATKWRYQ